jgi:arsenate reductase-like glutaredoxin family protein
VLRGLTTEAEERDLAKEPLTRDELRQLFKGRPVAAFLNTRNEEAKARGWNQEPPRDAELLDAMARNPNLLKRPLLVVEKEWVAGFDEAAYRRLLG